MHLFVLILLLLQGRLSVEAERNFIHPHNFVQVEVVKKKECNFCKHRLYQKTGQFVCIICVLNSGICESNISSFCSLLKLFVYM